MEPRLAGYLAAEPFHWSRNRPSSTCPRNAHARGTSPPTAEVQVPTGRTHCCPFRVRTSPRGLDSRNLPQIQSVLPIPQVCEDLVNGDSAVDPHHLAAPGLEGGFDTGTGLVRVVLGWPCARGAPIAEDLEPQQRRNPPRVAREASRMSPDENAQRRVEPDEWSASAKRPSVHPRNPPSVMKLGSFVSSANIASRSETLRRVHRSSTNANPSRA